MKKTLIMSVLTGLAVAAVADPVTVLNADFEAGADNNSAASWSDTGANAYYLAGEGTYSSGRAASLQDGAYTQQDLGIAANSYLGDWTISFDKGFRDDFFTGTANVAVSLIDAVDSTVFASGNFSVTGTGSANTGAIVFSADSVVLDMSGVSSVNNVILKFENTTGGGGSPWERTGLVDNVSVTAIPEPATMGLLAAFGGGLLFIRRKLMM